MEHIKYNYGNLPIPGGGYVTGFVYHPTVKNLLYCRTDIGGSYRYDYENSKWVSLIDHVTMFDISETFVTALALDNNHPERLYVACGINTPDNPKNGVFAVSEDYGNTFTYHRLPCTVHGNWPGRGTGSRLVVDPNNSDIIYFASQRGGLLRSSDRGVSWESVSIASTNRNNETNDTFIWVSPKIVKDHRSQVLILATTGIDNMSADKTMRGHSMYISMDAGNSWDELDMPECFTPEDVRLHGLMGHRYCYDGKYFYVTLSATGPTSYVVEEGYSCDSGDACDGRILRYPVLEDGSLGPYENITPQGGEFNYSRDAFNECGFGGICHSPEQPGLLVASTLCEKRGDMVFMSKDYGDTWEIKLFDLATNNISFNTSYMKPEHNGNHSIIHWLSDIKINPFDKNDVIFNSGTGVFGTYNFTDSDCQWCDRCTGIEETVHLNVYSPHKGDVIALDIVGDLGGFAFTDLHTPCRNSFDDADGNRYITCINADYADADPYTIVVTPRGNWTGLTKGGLIITKDQCKTFTHIDMPFGISPYIDSLLERILHPNVNSGWVALSADSRTIVWSVADMLSLPISAVVYSNDQGMTFSQSIFLDLNGNQVNDGCAKVFSDRINKDVFYAFDSARTVYISRDAGKTFIQHKVKASVPEFPLSNIDTFDKGSVCPDYGVEGTFYISMMQYGIWKFIYDYEKDAITYEKITEGDDVFYKIGVGINKNSEFLGRNKALYAAASINGEYGFYLSCDGCKSFVRINNDRQMFGDINDICGDSRVFGRFYIATGSRGLVYGEPV